MSPTKKVWLQIVIAVVVIAVLWFFLDHRYKQVLPSDLQPAAATSTASTAPAATVSATDANGNAVSATTNSQSTVKNLMHTVTIVTSKGTIVFETYDADAPNTVKNFLTLTDKGFYNGTIFHRVIPGFMIQGGDPTGTGKGGPGYQFADELNAATPSYQAGYVRGTLAMANSGPNTNGSQFFIMQADYALPHNYTIFGKVISGLDVVDAIANVPTDGNPPAGGNKPLTPITMTSVTEKVTQ
jgi:cyclophilin family peptidyl-prolyl cis-trans isomerase